MTDDASTDLKKGAAMIRPTFPVSPIPTLNRLAEYAAALETIITQMPGRPIVNGIPLTSDAALSGLRRRFGLSAAEIEAIEIGRTHVSGEREAR